MDQHHCKQNFRRHLLLKKTDPINLTILTFVVQLRVSQTEVPGAESLLFLPDSTRANLADMGDSVDQEIAMSQ